MKTHILISLVVLTFIVFMPRAQALFGHTAVEKARTEHVEQQLDQEQQHNSQLLQTNGQLIDTNQRLHTVVSILSAGVAVALVVGAAIGSKTRRDTKQP